MSSLAPSYERQMGTILPNWLTSDLITPITKKKIEIVYYCSQATVKIIIEEESLARERD